MTTSNAKIEMLDHFTHTDVNFYKDLTWTPSQASSAKINSAAMITGTVEVWPDSSESAGLLPGHR